MNIFLTSADPRLCAQALDDLRLNKMILETAQMLCVAYRHHFPQYDDIDLYKSTHINHPCTLWACKNIHNYIWLVNHFKELTDEKYQRTAQWHLSYVKLYGTFFESIANIEVFPTNIDFSFNCSQTFPSTGDVFEDYRICLIRKWDNDKREPTWTKRGPPEWSKV